MFRTRTWLPALLLLASPAWAHSDSAATLHVHVTPSGVVTADLRTPAEPFFRALGSEDLTYEAYRAQTQVADPQRRAWTADLQQALLLAVGFGVDGTWTTPSVGVSPEADAEWVHARYVASLAPGSETLTVVNGLNLGELLIQFSLADAEPCGEVFLDPGSEGAFPLSAQHPARSQGSVAWRYLVLGFEHILPKGLDHILFVLGLFLLSTRLKPLLQQITAFTLAHSVTLALSMLQVVSLPSSVVEPLIALSIVYVAAENVFTEKLSAWRPGVVFVFGLLHGLGFAGVLSELGLPQERFATALVTFNVGVELGQLCVVLIAFALVWRVRRLDCYRARVVVPASALIALTGLYWCVERTVF